MVVKDPKITIKDKYHWEGMEKWRKGERGKLPKWIIIAPLRRRSHTSESKHHWKSSWRSGSRAWKCKHTSLWALSLSCATSTPCRETLCTTTCPPLSTIATFSERRASPTCCSMIFGACGWSRKSRTSHTDRSPPSHLGMSNWTWILYEAGFSLMYTEKRKLYCDVECKDQPFNKGKLFRLNRLFFGIESAFWFHFVSFKNATLSLLLRN